MIALTAVRQVHDARQGDAGDRPEPDRGAAHGHQRRPRHRRHVRHRRRAGRASRASSTACTSTPSATRWGSRTALYAFTAAVLGGIGNIPGAVLGGLVIGLVRSLGSAYVGEQWSEALIFAHPDRDPDLPADRPARRPHPGEGMSLRRVLGYWPWFALAAFAAVPFLPGTDAAHLRPAVHCRCSSSRSSALGLNVVVGLHRPVAPRHRRVLRHRGVHHRHPDGPAVPVPAELPGRGRSRQPSPRPPSGSLTTAPTLRLRGDYLALVTLGFGSSRSSSSATSNTSRRARRGSTRSRRKLLPGVDDPNLASRAAPARRGERRGASYPYFYFLCLGAARRDYIFLGWPGAIAARPGVGGACARTNSPPSCMGLNPARLKLSAIALGAGLAGLAGALYAVAYKGTTGPAGVRLQPLDDHALLRHPRRAR